MSTLLIKPGFNRFRQTLALPAKSLNALIRTEIFDNFNFYQRQFGVYGQLTLNRKQKWVIHSMKGTPLLWQTHKSCSWDPMGSIRIGRREFTPCNAKLNDSWCYDDMFDSCFEHFLNWSGRGALNLDANGIEVVNQMIQTLVENAMLGARLTLTAGQLHDAASVTINDTVPSDIAKM